MIVKLITAKSVRTNVIPQLRWEAYGVVVIKLS